MNQTKTARSRARGSTWAACVLALLVPAAAYGQGEAGKLSAPGAVVSSYAIVGAAAKGVAGKLRDMYVGRPDVQISDNGSGQVIVSGAPSVQQEVARWLAEQGLVAAPVAPASVISQPPALTQAQRIVTHAWQLRNLPAREFENQLARIWGARLQASQDSVGDVATFRFASTSAGTTSIVVDRRTNTATVASPEASAPSWQRLMGILDSRPKSPDEQTKIVPVTKSDPLTIRKAVTLLTQLFNSADSRRKRHIGQFVSLLFQPEGGAAQPQPPPPPAPPLPPLGPGETAEARATGGGTSPSSLEAIARINNVQIEILDDVIVVRGRREDVDRVLRIIEQIEQQSIQFRPEIEVYYLKHADSVAMNDMITQVYAAAFSRIGPVTIIALQRPNALLLIGRKENIPAVIELIAKLDQPAPTDAEFKIFRLENMSAIDAERTIRQFFVTLPPTTQTQRPGMGTRAIVIADYRTNSLLVQAAPRDLAEITRLIKSLDVVESATMNEVRVFKLRNAIAATLEPILNEAITAAQASVTAQAVTGAAAQATAARATPPAVNLQFLDVGPEGQQMIRSGIMANVRIVADAQSNTLIVVGPPASMGLMEALIARLDALPGTEAQIKVFTVRNADATALATMLQNLFGTAAPAGGAQAAPGFATGTGAGDSAIVPLRFSVDQRTNSIIASGNAGDLNVIHAILLTLDEGDIRTRNTVVYRLRFAPAPDVANALTTLLAQQLTLIQTAPELVTPVEQLERQVIVVAEPVTNSLIISATSRYFPEIQRIVADLDRRPPMIVIQVLLAEVTLNDTEQFGIEWGLQDAFMFDRGIPPAAGGALQPGFGFNTPVLPNQNSPQSLATRDNVATQGLANFALGRADPTLGFGGLVLTASSESVNVLLRALERSARAQVISRPQVQTMDNVPAFVQVGAAVPRIQGATSNGLTVTPLVADINVGIVLNVTPRVSPDGTIVMQVYAEKSSVGPDATGIPVFSDAQGNVVRSPQIPKTLAQTTVSARTGQTVVLGGLITKDQREETRRVPYLADIPVLGRLFRFDSVINQRTELLVILTPYLVQTDDQIEWINQRETERMSWCVADIVNIQGAISVAGSPFMNPAATPVIFPDLAPGAPTPAELPPPAGMNVSPFPPYPPGLPLPQSMTIPGQPGPEPVAPAPVPAPGVPMPAAPPPAAPTPAPPPPVPPTPGFRYSPMGSSQEGSSRREWSAPGQSAAPASIIVPQPAATMSPETGGHIGGPAPRPIEPAMPPVGTQARLWPARLPEPPSAMSPDGGPYAAPGSSGAIVAPAIYQQ